MQFTGHVISREHTRLVATENDGVLAEDEAIYGKSLGVYDMNHA